MKKLWLMMVAGVFACSLFAATPAGWTTDFTEAQELAKKEKKVMYILFTGSDWCGYCMRLNQQVLSQKPFIDYAKDNLVLVYVDFPKNSKVANPAANQALAQKFQTLGFPTAILLDSTGKELKRFVGYNGNAKQYLAEIKKMVSGAK